MAARKSGAGVIETNNKKRSYEERNIDDYLPTAPAQDDDAVVAWYVFSLVKCSFHSLIYSLGTTHVTRRA